MFGDVFWGKQIHSTCGPVQVGPSCKWQTVHTPEVMVIFSSVRTWQAGNWQGIKAQGDSQFLAHVWAFLDAKPLDLGLVKKTQRYQEKGCSSSFDLSHQVSMGRIPLNWQYETMRLAK